VVFKKENTFKFVVLILNKINMKKIFLTAAAVFVLSFANAQDKKASSGEGFSKGDVFVTGSVGFTSNTNKDYLNVGGNYKSSDFNFKPTINYFLTENISLGLGLNFGSGSIDATTTSGSDKTSTVGAGLNGRYYFTPSSKFSVFTQLGFDFATLKMTPNVGTSTKDNSFGVAFAPGISYFVSSNFSIETKIAALSYSSSKGDWTNAENRTTFGLAADWSAVSFGVNYKF